MIFIVLFIPETLRSIAGNGTIKLTGIHHPLYTSSSNLPAKSSTEHFSQEEDYTVICLLSLQSTQKKGCLHYLHRRGNTLRSVVDSNIQYNSTLRKAFQPQPPPTWSYLPTKRHRVNTGLVHHREIITA